MSDYARALGSYQEALGYYRQLDDSFYVVRMLHRIGFCHFGLQEHLDDAREALEQSLAMARDLNDQVGMANSVFGLGVVACVLGDLDVGVEANLREAYAIRRRLGGAASITSTGSALALLAFRQGKVVRAKELADEALAIAIDINHKDLKLSAMMVQGLVACFECDYDLGEALLQKAIALPDPLRGAQSAWGLAMAAYGRKDYPAAKQHIWSAFNYVSRFSAGYGTICLPVVALLFIQDGEVLSGIELLSLALSHPSSRASWAESWPLITQLCTDLRASLGDEIFDAAWERGKALDLDTAVAVLRKELPASGAYTAQILHPVSEHMKLANQGLYGSLTPRECEILTLIARGFSNREIAEQLVIEVSTVKRHISNFYEKLGVTSRTQAVITAQELRLI